MADQRVVRKSLAGQDDLLFGEGQETQTRAGGTYNIQKNRVIYPVNSLEELNALDGEKFPKAQLYENDLVTSYLYNPSTEVYELTNFLIDPEQLSTESINDLSKPHVFKGGVAEYKAFTTAFPVGKRVYLADRDAYFNVIAGTGTANTFGIIASDSTGQSIELEDNGVISAKAYGAVPFRSRQTIDFDNPMIGEDSTGAIKAALFAAQEQGKQGTVICPEKLGNLDLDGETYIVSGENVLGAQVDDGDTYHYAINNGSIIWNRGAASNLFGGYNFTNARSLNLSNLQMYCADNPSISGTVFKFGEFGVDTRIGGGNFENVIVVCGNPSEDRVDNCCQTVFDCGGSTLADRFTIKDSSIYGFVRLFLLQNSEAVSWAFTNTDCLTGRDNAIFFDYTKNWSGSMDIDGCDIIGLGDNVTVFQAENHNEALFAQTNVRVNSRFEMRGDAVTWFNIDHTNFTVTGMNQAAGSGTKLNHTAFRLGGGASLSFNASTLAQKVILKEIDTRTGGRNGQAFLEDVSFVNGEPLVEYEGNPSNTSIKDIIAAGNWTTAMKITNSLRTINGVWGISTDERGMDRYQDGFIAEKGAAGYYRIANASNNTVFRAPSNILITSAKIYSAARPSGTDRVYLYVDGVATAFAVITSTTTREKYEIITAELGVYAIQPFATNDDTTIELVLTDVAGTPYDLNTQKSLICWGEIKYRPLANVADYSAGNVGIV